MGFDALLPHNNRYRMVYAFFCGSAYSFDVGAFLLHTYHAKQSALGESVMAVDFVRFMGTNHRSSAIYYHFRFGLLGGLYVAASQ